MLLIVASVGLIRYTKLLMLGTHDATSTFLKFICVSKTTKNGVL
jgi:hypothetical protein